MSQWERGALPSWALDMDRALPVQSQFIVSGNIRDVYPVMTDDGAAFKPALDIVWDVLARRGYKFLLIYDPVDNLRLYAPEQAEAASLVEGLKLDGRNPSPASLERLGQILRSLSRSRNAAGAIVIDYASRLIARPQDLSAEERSFFVACEKLAHLTRHLRAPGGATPPFNPIVWLTNGANDLPHWFAVGNETIRPLVAGLPDREARYRVAAQSARHFSDAGKLDAKRRDELVNQFALHTEGMTLRSLLSIAALARGHEFGLARIGDAIRAYKVGAPDDPWKQPLVREQIRTGAETIGKRVKGQANAIGKSLDILTRSVMGLTGAQANRQGARPRGVLFFAGPTGVGKTELAKAITQSLFGDESAYHRFDMSEFSAEHAEARLVGAPPGFVGHDAGGELVNAVRQRPFSVLLFDEIEKAHPRILDKFLQILEDGRLTDGRGETVFFSEAVIIFTSNLGVHVEDQQGNRSPNVTENDDYATVDARIKKAIGDYFRFKLERPELLNRIGEDNIVVFDFIRPGVARDIFDKMLSNICERVREEHGLTLTLSPQARATLENRCLERLDNGGRGIGNTLETQFINPLARALFARSEQMPAALEIAGFSERDRQLEPVFR
jgi:ATP-dependent Clp protease ATP-binding subunit ClpB